MTIQSFTGSIDTLGEFVTISSLTGINFITGKTYAIQIQNLAEIKIANAIFTFYNKEFIFTAGTESIYIKTNGQSCTLAILENEDM